MTPEQLKEIWNSELIVIEPDQLTKYAFQQVTLDILSSGMIDEVGELVFDYLEDGLQTVNTMCKLEDPNYDDFIAIGFNGSGDPVAIDLNNDDRLVYLNHDLDFEAVHINQNIDRFIETAVRVEAFTSKLNPLTKASFYSTEFSDADYDTLVSDLRFIDKTIFEQDSFWKETIEYMLWEREDERNKK